MTSPPQPVTYLDHYNRTAPARFWSKLICQRRSARDRYRRRRA